LGQFFNTVLRQPYDVPLNPESVKVVIDAGANIGDTACWYASKFPAAQIIALEPDQSNFAMLALNARPYGDRIKALRRALWHHDANLKIIDGGSSIGMSVRSVDDADDSDCTGISLLSLMTELELTQLDIVKIDVEGEELHLFAPKYDSWLKNASVIVVDVHSGEAAKVVRCAAARWGLQCEQYRELYVLRRGS
jgi:FkbM family methyltransferase